MNADRQRIYERIQGLLSKTVENGATEAEALAAANLARKLMDQYQITVTIKDIESGDEKVDLRVSEIFNKNTDRIASISVAIGEYTDTKVWKSGSTICFLGVGKDAEFALWLFETLVNVRDSEYTRFKQTLAFRQQQALGYHGRTLRANFTDGFAIRVSKRLREMKSAIRNEGSAESSHSNALVPVKNQAIAKEMQKMGLRLSKGAGYSGTQGRSSAAYAAGDQAGSRANIGRPIGDGSSSTKYIR